MDKSMRERERESGQKAKSLVQRLSERASKSKTATAYTTGLL